MMLYERNFVIAVYFPLQITMEPDFIMAGIEVGRIEISKRAIFSTMQLRKPRPESNFDGFNSTEKKCAEFAVKFVEHKNLFKSGSNRIGAVGLLEGKKVGGEAIVIYG